MQSFNKIPSFGDDTLSACIQVENKNMNIIDNHNNVDKYFKHNIYFSMVANDVDKVTQLKEGLCNFTNKKPNLNPNNSKCKETNKSKTKKIMSFKKNDNLFKIDKENVNMNDNCTRDNISSNTNTLSNNKSELLTLHVNNLNKNNVAYMTTNDMTNVNLSNSNSSINNTEKISEINPSISIIPTQDRCKLSSWGLPLNILQVK